MTSKRTELILFLLLALVLVALELVSAILAYETIGAIASTLYFLAIGINIVFFVLAVRSRAAAAAGMIVLALVIVPYQFTLAQRLMRVQAEAARVVGYIYEYKLGRGDFPTSLVEYAPRDAEMKTYIQEFRRDAASGGFVLCYVVGTQSTSHCYSPKNGWTYVAD